jgi:hypothetical protein
MRHPALIMLIVLAASLGAPIAMADDLSRYAVECDDGSDGYGSDDDGGFLQELLGAFYEYTEPPAPGEPRDYPRPYDPNPCADDEDCFEPSDFYLPTCEGESENCS